MSTKKAKIVANGTGLERQSVPGESILFQLTGEETGGAMDYMIVTVAPNSGPPPRRHWINFDLIWAVALLVVGAIALYTAI